MRLAMADVNFHTLNSGEVIELYERFLRDPSSVDAETRSVFSQWQPPMDGAGPLTGKPAAASTARLDKIVGVVNLAQAIREYGYLEVRLDPLGFFSPPGDESLRLEAYGLTEEDLRGIPAGLIGGPLAGQSANAAEAVRALRQVYTTHCGYDYGHIHEPKERAWLRAAAEEGRFRPDLSVEVRRALLERLTRVEVFEQFLHRFFPGKTRFSIEGVDMLVPMLDEIVESAAEAGICTILIGMPHRGRLNILAHVLAVPYERILTEFKDPAGNVLLMHEQGWTGDVKYHLGARFASPNRDEVRLIIGMPPIPSHLELVNPVVAGMARSLQSKIDRAGPPVLYPDANLPVLIHGDAAFPGEGIVAESLNLSRLPGYQVAGTIHIIANNQLGFTTLPAQGRSTLFASDPAKGFEIPIVHVNADQPQACLEAVRTAFAYRETFHKDFLIDLVGYRRYGHNEGDEPVFTQPRLYALIEKKPSIRKQWADQLVKDSLVEPNRPGELTQQAMGTLQLLLEDLPAEKEAAHPPAAAPLAFGMVKVKPVKQETLQELADSLLRAPEGFKMNPKLARAMERRRKVIESPAEALVDWSMAEELALASILADGIAVRLTGQDVERGTFSQRHAVFLDIESEKAYIPLQSIPQARASFEVQNSPLSEAAALAFEYGYDVENPHALVILEAQYGDFTNNAQSILDEFILSGRAKWEQQPSLVLSLPHGNEGQGPNHSSGRPERFLQLGGETSLRLANCTTAAQYFHLLRDQAACLSEPCLPLVILTPKSLLRHPRVASSLRDLARGRWMPVLDDPQAPAEPSEVKRLVLCSGKIAIDLMDSELRGKAAGLAIVRLEQLCPFPAEELKAVFERYPNVKEIAWAQEEPQNMGAWAYAAPKLADLIGSRLEVKYIGRPASSSSSEGSFTLYTLNQKKLVRQVLQPEEERKPRRNTNQETGSPQRNEVARRKKKSQ
jgi:2-oxoglutarate dehydrogenase E1 component